MSTEATASNSPANTDAPATGWTKTELAQIEVFLKYGDRDDVAAFFDKLIAVAVDDEVRDRWMMLKLYFTNEDFKAHLTDHIASVLKG